MNSKKSDLLSALHDTIPIMTGYIVLGMGFGIIMNASGISFRYVAAMSVFIYAGSMQYAAIGLLTGGASYITIALTTLAVNIRHLFYGLSMIEKYKGMGIRKPYLIFSLTDETYSLVSSKEKSRDYYFLVSLFDHIYWVAGSALGSIIGSAVHFNSEGVDFALTALFITIFTDQWMKSKNHFPAVCGAAVTALCLMIFGSDMFLIPSMLGITVILLIGMKKEEKNEQ